jgi:hypothetical protein
VFGLAYVGACSLIRSMLSLDPTKRPTVKQILAHPWFTQDIFPAPPSALPSPARQVPPHVLSPAPTLLTILQDSNKSFFPLSSPALESIPSSPKVSSASSSETHDAESFGRSTNSSATTPSGSSMGADDKETEEPAELEEGDGQTPGRNVLRRTESDATIGKTDDAGRRTSKVDSVEKVTEEEEEDHEEEDDLSREPHPLLPLAQSSRTPSRTKRRSISSTLSQSLAANSSSTHLPIHTHTSISLPYPATDYLSLLSEQRPVHFSSSAEQNLLSSLSTIGIDTGQLVHSVTHDACDTSGALWWLLKGKKDREEKKRDSISSKEIEGEREMERRAKVRRKGSVERQEAEQRVEQDEEEQDRTREARARRTPSPTQQVEAAPLALPLESPAISLRSNKGEPTVELATVTDDPFGNPVGISLGPVCVEPPTPTFPSFSSNASSPMPAHPSPGTLHPDSMSTSKSSPSLTDHLSSHPMATEDSQHSSGSCQSGSSPASSPGKSRRSEAGKSRSSSVSMLQSLTLGLVRKKSDDQGFKDEVGKQSAPPSLSQSFSHLRLSKASHSNEDTSKPNVETSPTASTPPRPLPTTHQSESSSTSSHSHLSNQTYETTSSSPTATPGSPFQERDGRLPPVHSYGSSIEADTLKSKGTPKRDSILTTFRMWFKEDSRKRGAKGRGGGNVRSSSPLPLQAPSSGEGSSETRGYPSFRGPVNRSGTARSSSVRSSSRHSAEHRSKPLSSSNYPPSRRASDRPSLSHRSSSQQSFHSRRSSIASLHLPPIDLSLSNAADPNYGLHRRPSDPGRRSLESRTPNSEARSHSRPSSLRSFNLSYPPNLERNLSRSPTASSAGSASRRAQASPLQIYHRRVGSGSSTKVVRQIKTIHSTPHMRSPSVTSARSARSVISSPNSGLDLAGLAQRAELEPLEGSALLESLDEGSETAASTASPTVAGFNLDNSSSSSLRSHHSRSTYSTTVLVAHRSKSALSSASPSHHHHSFSSHHPSSHHQQPHLNPSVLTPRLKPIFRDVFAKKDDDDEDWVDEDKGFEGGLGQGPWKPQRSGSGGGLFSSSSSSYSSAPSSTPYKSRPITYPSSTSWTPSFSSSAPASSSSSSQRQTLAPNSFLPSSNSSSSTSPTTSFSPDAVQALDLPSISSTASRASSSSSSTLLGPGSRRGIPPSGFRSNGILEIEEEEEEEE